MDTLRFRIKVSSGPGTAGYENRTAKQNAKEMTWAGFATDQDAQRYATQLHIEHPTWIIRVHDVEQAAYNRRQAAHQAINDAALAAINS